MKRLLALALLGTLAAASQAVVLYNDDFESYAVGSSLSDSSNYNPASDPEFTVATGGVSGQGVFISTPPLIGNYYAWHDLNYAPTAANPLIVGSLSVKSVGVNTTDGTTTSFHGAGFYDPAGAAFAVLQVQATAGTSTASYRLFAAGDTTFTTGSLTLPVNTFVQLKVQLDTTLHSASYFLNNSLIATRPYTLSDATIGDFDLLTSATGYDDAIYDNYRVEALNPVPEPASLAALGLGALALARRRRAK